MNRSEPAEEFWEMNSNVMIRLNGCLFVHIFQSTKITENGRLVLLDAFLGYAKRAGYIDGSHQLHVVVEHLTLS